MSAATIAVLISFAANVGCALLCAWLAITSHVDRRKLRESEQRETDQFFQLLARDQDVSWWRKQCAILRRELDR